MASIRVLELRPQEDLIEDLSYDMSGSIVGGTVSEIFTCLADFWEGIFDAKSSEDVFLVQATLIRCLDKAFG